MTTTNETSSSVRSGFEAVSVEQLKAGDVIGIDNGIWKVKADPRVQNPHSDCGPIFAVDCEFVRDHDAEHPCPVPAHWRENWLVQGTATRKILRALPEPEITAKTIMIAVDSLGGPGEAIDPAYTGATLGSVHPTSGGFNLDIYEDGEHHDRYYLTHAEALELYDAMVEGAAGEFPIAEAAETGVRWMRHVKSGKVYRIENFDPDAIMQAGERLERRPGNAQPPRKRHSMLETRNLVPVEEPKA